MINFLKHEIYYRLRFVYDLMGPIKKMFWISVMLMFLSAAWEGVILTAVATMFQTLVETSEFSTSTFKKGDFMNWVYGFFSGIPKDYLIIIGFSFSAISILMGSFLNAAITTFQTNFSTRFIISVRCKVFEKIFDKYVDKS